MFPSSVGEPSNLSHEAWDYPTVPKTNFSPAGVFQISGITNILESKMVIILYIKVRQSRIVGNTAQKKRRKSQHEKLPLCTEARRAATLWWKESLMSTRTKGIPQSCSRRAASIPPKPPPTMTTRTESSTESFDPIPNHTAATEGEGKRLRWGIIAYTRLLADLAIGWVYSCKSKEQGSFRSLRFTPVRSKRGQTAPREELPGMTRGKLEWLIWLLFLAAKQRTLLCSILSWLMAQPVLPHFLFSAALPSSGPLV